MRWGPAVSALKKLWKSYKIAGRTVTYLITLTRGTPTSKFQKPLLVDFFHAHNGLLTLHVEPNPGLLTIYGKQDPFLNAWVADPGGNILIRGPLLLQGGLYHFHVEIFTVDNDRSLFIPQQAPKFDAYLSVGSVYDKNETYHNHNYNTTLISYYNQIHNLNFNPSTPMFTWSMPFDYNMTRIKQQPIFVHEEMRLPKSWKGFGDLTQFNATVNGQRLSGRSLAIDSNSFPNDTIVNYLVNKNDIIRIAEAFNANHTKNAVTSRSVNTTGLMNFVLEPSGKPSAQIRNTTNGTSSLIVQQTVRQMPAGNNMYTNSTDGISFSIPENWTTEEGQNHANATRLTVVTISPPIALDPSALMQVIVQKETKPLTSSVDQYLRDQLSSHRSNPSNNFKLISANTNNVTISGHPAFRLLWTFTPQASYAGLNKQLEVGTLLNGQGYLIDYSGSISLFSKFLPQVQQIIKTLMVQPLATTTACCPR